MVLFFYLVEFIFLYLNEMLQCIRHKQHLHEKTLDKRASLMLRVPRNQASHRSSVVIIQVLSWERDIGSSQKRLSEPNSQA